MHLFVSGYTQDGDTLTLTDERLTHYIHRVLRMRPGDTCLIQPPSYYGTTTHRHRAQLIKVTKKEIEARIQESQEYVKNMSKTSLLVALPNKYSKCELIVQKATEVGIDSIIFWRGERSLLKEISAKKMKRLEAIALESVEQCQRRTVPEVDFVEDISPYLQDGQVVVFDFVDTEQAKAFHHTSTHNLVAIVGPEGHFGEKDYAIFSSYDLHYQSLGDHILRTETAAIVGGWRLVQQSG